MAEGYRCWKSYIRMCAEMRINMDIKEQGVEAYDEVTAGGVQSHTGAGQLYLCATR